MMQISELARQTGVPATTLRFYETAGLLSARRSTAGYRLYGPEAVERLEFVGTAKRLGLSLEEIAALLDVWADGPCAEVKGALRPRIAANIAAAEARAAELTAFTATLHRAIAHLDALPDRDERCDASCDLRNATVACRPAPPVACALDAAALGDRTAQWRELGGSVLSREVVPGGIRLTMPAELACEVATLAAGEQRCCPFFAFRLTFAGPVIHLEVQAPAEGLAMLREFLAAKEALATEMSDRQAAVVSVWKNKSR